MTEEEMDALDTLNRFEPDDLIECSIYLQCVETIKNLINRQDDRIKHLEEVRANQQKELAILNEKQKDLNRQKDIVSSCKGQIKRLNYINKKLIKEKEALYKNIDNEISRLENDKDLFGVAKVGIIKMLNKIKEV